MSKKVDSKTVYAQSSDIKSRTYLEYRCDMKRKAIAELEIQKWFQGKLKQLHETDNVTLAKSGGDAHLWFLRSGGISGEPDYEACINGKKLYFEFQYSNRDDLPFFDFKVSKVGKKVKGERVPHANREFLYILKPTTQFAIFSPKWVMENGKEAGVPAWGNRTAYRVPQGEFKKILVSDSKLVAVIEAIEAKNRLLDLQSQFIQRESTDLAVDLQKIVDHDQTFQIIPKTLDGIYTTCLLMDKLKEFPTNHTLWLVYATTFYSTKLNSLEFARLLYALDFLYSGSPELKENELKVFVETMRKISAHLEAVQKKNLKTSADFAPAQELVNFIFAVNLYEDLIQDLRHSYGVTRFPAVKKIFQSVHELNSLSSEIV